MRKFDCEHVNSLEVLSYARYLPGYLNRQLVLCLSTLGVPDRLGRSQYDALNIANICLRTVMHLAQAATHK